MANCNCIADFNAKLAPEQELDTSIAFSLSTNQMTVQTYTTLVRKSTGKPERRRGQPRLAAHSFCPFCGTSYKASAGSETGQ